MDSVPLTLIGPMSKFHGFSRHFSTAAAAPNSVRKTPVYSRKKMAVYSASLGAVCLAGAFYREEIQSKVRGTIRLMRTVATVAIISADYKLAIWRMNRAARANEAEFAPNSEMKSVGQSPLSRLANAEATNKANDATWMNLHYRAAHRFLRLMESNGGIFIKLGQHLASLDYLLPQAYCQTFRNLFNKAPCSAIEDVQSVVEQDLQAELSDLFSYFDPTPVGCASLAQVHRAVLKDEKTRVAVKVQHKRQVARLTQSERIHGV
jgi:hypothetical protein